MIDKAAEQKNKSPWPADIAAEFERESKNPNPCVGSTLLSENERTRVWIIRLAPGERIGFHRHVLILKRRIIILSSQVAVFFLILCGF